jgi:phospholipid N-methyltransferase
LIGCKIPGFFITPKETARKVVDLADIREGMEVLEPSAGKGDIAELVNHGSKLTCIEYQQKLAKILELKGFNAICGDFLEHTGQYDRIVMNPPFENFQDIKHVNHAFQCLKDGGRIVAIMGEGVFFRQDKIAVEFREWIEEMGTDIIDLPAGAFQGTITSTGVKARIVIIDK